MIVQSARQVPPGRPTLYFPLVLAHTSAVMRTACMLLALLLSRGVSGAVFELPREEYDVVGYPQVIDAHHEDTLLDIALRFGVGQDEIVSANPAVDRWLPGEGTRVLIPSRYVLPDAPREGLVLNLPEMRIYYFPPPVEGEPARVETYPVSIGRMDWATPLGATTIVRKQRDPPWYPPESIRREHEEQGDPLPRMVPPGPDNPLGRFALRLGIPGYLIHGTNKPFGVGMRVSHGCIRMLPDDIERLFPQVETGTPVHIINQPIKAGWYGGDLLLEAHRPLEEHLLEPALEDNQLTELLDRALSRRPGLVDEGAIERALAERSGVPVPVSAER